MPHWEFDKDITKELIAACSTAGIPASRMRKGGLPHIATIRRWRATDPQFDARIQAASGAQPKEYDWEQVRRELLAGHSLSGLHKQVPNRPMWYEIAARGRANPAWFAPIREALIERERERLRRKRRPGSTFRVLT
ncbi:MAG TPA: hypothetical protein VGO22_00075 [Pseudorhizobium sp.]|jgi:hypothetical protein|nr:hypothetical protein [Pseudorhizobium sp.]